MNQQILVPDIGDYSAVEIIEVIAKSGDEILKEDTLIVLETDKATMDIPAPYDLKIVEMHVKKGDRISKGNLIATVIATTSSSSSSLNQNTTVSTTNNLINTNVNTAPQTISSIENTNAFSHASPSIRKLARELGTNLDNIKGTGNHGRILEEDIKKHINNLLTSGTTITANITNAPVNNFNSNFFSKWGEVSTQQLSRIKKKSGQALLRNWVSIPHVTHFDEADITELENFRNQQQEIAKAKGIKLTPLAFFIKAITNGLKNFPLFNSSLETAGDNLIIKKYYNIGIAVDTDQGLVVPVVKNTDQKTLFQIAEELGTLSQKARDGKLLSDDMQGGCFTISSLGGISGVGFTPIINAPEVAILGVSRSQFKPIYINDKLYKKLILPIALSYDHRVIDGADAARFCKFITEQLTDLTSIKNYEYSN